MGTNNFSIGDKVFIYSVSLDEIIQGRVEGFSEDRENSLKILQKVSDGYIRHIVSSAYIFEDRLSAEEVQREERTLRLQRERPLEAGVTVNLMSKGSLVKDEEGYPLLYQITAVHESDVSLVTSYGEPIGKYRKSDIIFYSSDPIFNSKDYEVGQQVSWISKDSVYEGTITKLRGSTAEVMNIKQLFPIDQKMNVPYYKLSGVLQETSQILTTLIGDNLED